MKALTLLQVAASSGNNVVNTIFSVLLIAALTVGLFVVLRSIVLWYFRITDIVTLLEKIEKNTRKCEEPTEGIK